MAGKISVNQVQLGDSSTATNNFVWQTNVDGTCKLARGNVGATTQDILTVDASGLVTFSQGKQLTIGTSIATTSGTYHDFSPANGNGIPSWAKRITVMISGISTNGTSNIQVQFGSGSMDTTGYVGTGTRLSGGSTTSASFTSGIGIPTDTASATHTGKFVLEHLGGNVWEATAQVGGSNTATYLSGGGKTLSGILDRVRLTTVNGTDTFDAGVFNVMYEG